ncbi:MAG: PHP domain-containing protein [Candidatus Pacebacteria bacterium]|nr:PHP domain-containing protein [Candidatus Paceibacterota bacterium]
MSKFTHLHTHSHYSLLNALPKIDNILNKAEKCGATSIALTDDGVMYGVVDFYKKAIKKNIKPIIGVDFYVALRTRHDKQSRVDNKRYRLVLLAKNNQGYKNLMKLVSFSFIDGYYYKPRIDRELIKKYSEGLVAILPQFSSETSSHLKLNNIERAKESFNFYSKIFNDDLYFEIVHHPEMEEQVELQKSIIDFCNKNKSKLVATSDFYYLEKNQKKARDILTDIGAVRSGGNYHNDTDDFSYKTEKEMIENFSHIPKAISNTKEIEKKCNLKLELGK